MKNFTFIFLLVFTLISCESSDTDGTSSDTSTGKGGSMARFTIANNYLYTVDNENLKVFSLSNPEKPVAVQTVQAGFHIETIFAFKNTLYLGSQWGIYIFDITTPDSPQKLTYYSHIYSCDPVVANDSLAYLTMRTGTYCGRNTNELQVINIKDKKNPKFVKSIPMTFPQGLGFEDKNLFVCDGGLKVFSLEDPVQPVLKKTFNIPAVDVIPDKNLLMVMATDGLHQYWFDNDTITYLSHLQ
jgi:hypothetical protein